jgi:hypothetical protein
MVTVISPAMRIVRPTPWASNVVGLASGSAGRYEATHRLVYRYARERLEAADEVLERLVAYLAALAKEETALGREGLARLELERPHIKPLVEACEKWQAWRRVVELAFGVDGYLDRAGFWSERTEVLEAGFRAAGELGD